jgi:HD superfamily phosphohydrolase
VPEGATEAPQIGAARQELVKALGDFEVDKLAAYKQIKIVHEPVWGTCSFDPWEVSMLELNVFQRLRGLKQTGFAYFTYPSAEHSRFQHSLGVAEAASRVFDSIFERVEYGGVSPVGLNEREKSRLFAIKPDTAYKDRLRVLLRVATLVHDSGHSVFSHSSERIYGLVPPFHELSQLLKADSSPKAPGAAEIVVYLLVTSPEWQSAVKTLWKRATSKVEPPTPQEWERIGRWVMGQEADPEIKFVADIVSGPLDADKLDYVFRDGYVAGIPVGYDLQRLISTITVDPQASRGKSWWRLTLPIRGINALEQLVMGRLVLNSYLYHHHKCRAAETAFERALAREYVSEKTIVGKKSVWDLFVLTDADTTAFSHSKSASAAAIRDLLARRLKVRVAEFREADLPATESSSVAYEDLVELASPRTVEAYKTLLHFEDSIAKKAGLPEGSVIFDVPKPAAYADLENLRIPGRPGTPAVSPTQVLNYRDWIASYSTYRQFIRVFGPRGQEKEDAVWAATLSVLGDLGVRLSNNARVQH